MFCSKVNTWEFEGKNGFQGLNGGNPDMLIEELDKDTLSKSEYESAITKIKEQIAGEKQQVSTIFKGAT